MAVTTRGGEPSPAKHPSRKLIPTAVSTLHGDPTWWPTRKVLMGGLGAFVLVVVVALLNEFVLSPANQIPIWGLIMPFVPPLVSYASKAAAAEGTQP